MLKWWGYRHINGSIQAKRFFDERDVLEATQSDFVRQAVGPFLASGREDALQKVRDRI